MCLGKKKPDPTPGIVAPRSARIRLRCKPSYAERPRRISIMPPRKKAQPKPDAQDSAPAVTGEDPVASLPEKPPARRARAPRKPKRAAPADDDASGGSESGGISDSDDLDGFIVPDDVDSVGSGDEFVYAEDGEDEDTDDEEDADSSSDDGDDDGDPDSAADPGRIDLAKQGIDQANVVTGKRVRRPAQSYTSEVYGSAEYRRMMLSDIPASEMKAAVEDEDFSSESDTDDESETASDDDSDGSCESDGSASEAAVAVPRRKR